MSTGKGTFSNKQIEDLRTQFRGPPTPTPEVEASGPYSYFDFVLNRSYHRVGLILGITASAIGAYYGVRYLCSSSSGEKVDIPMTSASTADSEISVRESGLMEAERPKKNIKVILHQCPRGYNTPCISPFSLKLETFLRVANIPYEVKYTAQPHLKNSPWLTVGDHDIVDAHECITFLSNTFEIDLERTAKPSRLTASRLVGIQLDNHIYWGIALWRWVYDKGASLKDIQPLSPQALSVIASVSESVRKAAWYHGLGRLPYEKVLEIITTDLADLSAALGRHSFFLGERPGEIDCNAFAMLSQMNWNMPGSPFEAELKKYENLVNFVFRVRDTFWPDWAELLHKPGEHKIPEKFYYPTSEFHMSMTGILKNAEAYDPAEMSGNEEKGEDDSENGNINATPRSRSTDSRGQESGPEENSPPAVPNRKLASPGKPPSGMAPQLQPNGQLRNPMMGGENYPPRIQQENEKLASMNQGQLKKVQTLLADLNKQFSTLNPDVSMPTPTQQTYFNNNLGPAGGPPQYQNQGYAPNNLESVPRLPAQGRAQTGFYAGNNIGMVPPQQPGVFGPPQQQNPMYYNNTNGVQYANGGGVGNPQQAYYQGNVPYTNQQM